MEAKYINKIKLLETERDQHKQNMIKQKEEFDQKLSQAMDEQEATIQLLSTQFKKQHEIIDSIRADILSYHKNKTISIYTAVLVTLLVTLFYTLGANPSFYFLKRLGEWYTSFRI